MHPAHKKEDDPGGKRPPSHEEEEEEEEEEGGEELRRFVLAMMASSISPALVTLALTEQEEEEREERKEAGEGQQSHEHPLTTIKIIEEEKEEEEENEEQEQVPTTTEQQQLPKQPQSKLARMKAKAKKLRSVLLLLFAVVLLLVVGSYFCIRYKQQLLKGSEWIKDHAPASAVYYACIVAVWIVACLPSTIIEMAAGSIFSYPVAICTLTVGKQVGCTLAFLLGRCLASNTLRNTFRHPHQQHHHHKAEHEEEQQPPSHGGGVPAAAAATTTHTPTHQPKTHGRRRPLSKRQRTIQAMFVAMEAHPWKITLLLRFLPVPISLKNYGMACMGCLPAHVFFICTFVASLPFTLVWVHLGESCKNLLEALNGEGLKKHGAFAQELALLVVGLVLLVVLMVVLRRYTRRYAKELEAEEMERVTAAAANKEGDQRGGKGWPSPPTTALTEEGCTMNASSSFCLEDDDNQSCFSHRMRSRDMSSSFSEVSGGGEEVGATTSSTITTTPTSSSGGSSSNIDLLIRSTEERQGGEMRRIPFAPVA